MSDFDKMRDRHWNGMCGGDCPECFKQQQYERERDEYERAAYEDANRADSARTGAVE